MTNTTVGFVGSGRVASILLGGWARAGALPARIVVSDADPKVAEALAARYAQVESSGEDLTEAARQDVVLLGLHPPVIPQAAEAVAAGLQPKAVLVSLAPKITGAKLAALLGGFARIARMIPNAPSIVGRGYNPVAYGDALAEGERNTLRQLFAALGENPEVPEEHLEAYAVVSAMGPTYLWPQLYRLTALAESFGLAPEAALSAVGHMVSGTAAAMTDAGLPPDEVMDLIPVKPLQDMQAGVLEQYEAKLTALMEKLRS